MLRISRHTEHSKKVTGALAEQHYGRVDPYTGEWKEIIPEYTTMSRRPGIGKKWYEKFKSDVYPHDRTPIIGQNTVVNGSPRYYMDQLEQEDKELHDTIKLQRRRYMQDNKDEYTPERLMARYNVHKAKVNQLKRTLK